ncbi:hypothetical protein D3C71_21670 [compost metagenome]
MEKLLRFLGALDWVVATGTLVAAAILQSWWLAAAGALGLCTAYLQPAKRIRAWIEKRFVRKPDNGAASTAQVQHDDAFYAQVLGQADELPVAAAAPKRTYASPPVPYAGMRLSRSKHNRLRVEHLQLMSKDPLPRQYF